MCIFGKRAFEKGESGCMLGLSGGAVVDDIPGAISCKDPQPQQECNVLCKLESPWKSLARGIK